MYMVHILHVLVSSLKVMTYDLKMVEFALIVYIYFSKVICLAMTPTNWVSESNEEDHPKLILHHYILYVDFTLQILL